MRMVRIFIVWGIGNRLGSGMKEGREWELLTSPFVPFPQEAIPEDVQSYREERDGEEVHVRVPHGELHRVVRSGDDGGSDELGFFRGTRSISNSFEKRPILISVEDSPPKTASVVTSVNQPAILIHPTRKLWFGRSVIDVTRNRCSSPPATWIENRETNH